MKNLSKRVLGLVLIMVILLSTMTGCFASWDNQRNLTGGILSNSKSDYIVLNESCGTIMDCWILKNTFVQSEDQSDGFRFTDNLGRGVIVQGDAVVMRLNSATDVSMYIEYHIGTDLVPYA